jgi:hypothetical protein
MNALQAAGCTVGPKSKITLLLTVHPETVKFNNYTFVQGPSVRYHPRRT